ncbi:MAG: hypothetical protein ACSW8F_05175, partial [bacterium]
MSKKSYIPPTPEKMKLPEPLSRFTTRRDWEKNAQEITRSVTKMLRKKFGADALASFDYTGAILERRRAAALDSVMEIAERYADFPESDPNLPGDMWLRLNLGINSYDVSNRYYRITTAAAIWILDQIDVDEAFPLLPREEALIEDYLYLELWHPSYAPELIASVEYVLTHWNGPPESLPEGFLRCLSPLRAEGTPAGRENFEALIALVPEEARLAAEARLESLIKPWTERFFEGLRPIALQAEACQKKRIEIALQHNAICDELDGMIRELVPPTAPKKKRPAVLKAAQQELPNFSALAQGSSEQQFRVLLARITSRMEMLKKLSDANIECLEMLKDLYHAEDAYLTSTISGKAAEIFKLPALPIGDIYELSFAAILLATSGKELAWLYGPVVSIIQEIAICLPWCFRWHGDEEKIEIPEPYTGKPSAMPDWYARKYIRKNEEDCRHRNLAQFIYDKTGGILPQDMHRFDRYLWELGQWGVRGKDAAFALTAMCLLNEVGAQREAKNLVWYTEEDERDESAADARREENAELKRLRSALHEAEKAARDAKKALEATNLQAEQERRELADLRELIFNQENAPEEETAEEAEERIPLPYEVRRSTLVFGGHKSWSREIRQLLRGNIRFIDKDLVFDTGIIRNADVLWIQTNALAHKNYYRIIDAARINKKPVRYFTS